MRLFTVFLLALVVSCAYGSTPTAFPATPTIPAPTRPRTNYEIGGWNQLVSTAMTEQVRKIMTNLGETDVDPEVEVVTAVGEAKEVVILKHKEFPKEALSYWSAMLSLKVKSEYYGLNPESLIEAQYRKAPYGRFFEKSPNIRGFCVIPWASLSDFVDSNLKDRSIDTFRETWDCF